MTSTDLGPEESLSKGREATEDGSDADGVSSGSPVTPAAMNCVKAGRPLNTTAERRLEMEAYSELGMRRVPDGLFMQEEHGEFQTKVISSMASLHGVLVVFVKEMNENAKTVHAVELVLHKKSNTKNQLARSLRASSDTNEQLYHHEDLTPRVRLETSETEVAHMKSPNECETMQN